MISPLHEVIAQISKIELKFVSLELVGFIFDLLLVIQKNFRITLGYLLFLSGPAGFYTAQYLLKHLSNSHVDLLEKLPVPFGLVR